jgi:hypothetical protein
MGFMEKIIAFTKENGLLVGNVFGAVIGFTLGN